MWNISECDDRDEIVLWGPIEGEWEKRVVTLREFKEMRDRVDPDTLWIPAKLELKHLKL